MDTRVFMIEYKYKNNVIKDLPSVIERFLTKNPKYDDLFFSKEINVEDILYFLKNKIYKTEEELMKWILIIVEAKHGIFERIK